MLPVPSERYVPVVESPVDEDQDPHPCEEDEEFFKSRPNAEEMEDAISKFLDAMPTVESKRYEQLHRHLARLPVPESKTNQFHEAFRGSGRRLLENNERR